MQYIDNKDSERIGYVIGGGDISADKTSITDGEPFIGLHHHASITHDS